MSESIKMTEGELLEVRTMQDKFQQKIFQLGQLYLQKLQAEATMKSISDSEVKLKDEWLGLQKVEAELIDSFLKKYGEGSLDLQSGTFISDKVSNTTIR